MDCIFCGKAEVNKRNHVCSQKSAALAGVVSFYKDHEEHFIEGWNTEKYTGAEAFALDIIKEGRQQKILSESIPYEESAGTIAAKLRVILKGKGLYIKSTKARYKKMEETMMNKYGVKNNGQLAGSRKKLSERNNAEVYKVSFMKDFKDYAKKVAIITSRNKSKIGIPDKDFYTGLAFPVELSNPDLMQGDLYPTIDHKLSVVYCYTKGISAEECGAPANLAWTFRYLNSLKQNLTDQQFRETMLPMIRPLIEKELSNKGWIHEAKV